MKGVLGLVLVFGVVGCGSQDSAVDTPAIHLAGRSC
jgi:hypothetical protein